MLKSLKDDTEFVKIKSYRAYNGKDKELKELKKYWTLPVSSEDKDRQNAIFEVLNNIGK